MTMSPDFSSTIAGIIPAAGQGSRMGSRVKQLMPFKNTTLLGQVIHNALKSDLDPVIVVLGYRADDILRRLQPDELSVQTIINDQWRQGQSSSVKKGVEQLPEQCRAAMFLLSDQPLVHEGIINRMILSFNETSSPIGIPFFDEKRGNPVIIHHRLFPELMGIEGDMGARALFTKYENSILKIGIDDPAVVMDADTHQEYQTMIQYASQKKFI